MVVTRNRKYANSSSNYYVIMMGQILKKISKLRTSNFFRISETRIANLKQTTTASGLFARDTS